ncbi:hypothetical protein [Gracilinema caldarium]|uniref:hypothetical protein n=1 Tax=Gracilinema caldarium TaxID=215591 RepID=UPI0026F2F6FA|nr:hypothetical protein [Gracilinema caldarium]
MKTLWKGHANPRVGLGMILAAVCAALFFTACPWSESPETEIPDLSGYWFAENISVPSESGPVSGRGLAIIENGSIKFLSFNLQGDQLAGMRGTYTNNEDTMTVQVAATYDTEKQNWIDETSTDVIPYTLVNNVLTMDIPGPSDSTITVPFTKIAAPLRPDVWIGTWSGTWGTNEGTATATLQGDGSFMFSFDLGDDQIIDFLQTGFWQVITFSNTNYLVLHITNQTINPEPAVVDFYGLTKATLSSNNTHATIETSMGNLELTKQ